MKKLFLVAVLCFLPKVLFAATFAGGTFEQPVIANGIISGTVAQLPTTGLRANESTRYVTDGSTSSDCAAGGGSNINLCRWTGSAWTVVTSSGGGTASSTTFDPAGTNLVATTVQTALAELDGRVRFAAAPPGASSCVGKELYYDITDPAAVIPYFCGGAGETPTDIRNSFVDGTTIDFTVTGLQVTAERAALTGDVTASAGSNATTIADAAVTYAKIQNVTDARILCRSSGSAGPPIECTVGAGLSLSAGALTATSSGSHRYVFGGNCSTGSSTKYMFGDRFTDACADASAVISGNQVLKVTKSGTAQNLRCESDNALTSGHTFTVTVQTGTLAGLADTAITVAETSASKIFVDTTHTAAVTAGQWLRIKGVHNNTSNAGPTQCTLEVAF